MIWRIPYAMNTNQVSQKAGYRLERIQKVSRCFRAFFLTFTLLLIVTTLWSTIALIVTIVHLISTENVLHVCLATGTDLAFAVGAWFCYRLFNLYSHGDLFTSKIVQYIRRIAVMYFVVMLARFLSHSFMNVVEVKTIPGYEWTRWLGLVFSLFPSFLILFIAWVMDEGRKIREEQALIV